VALSKGLAVIGWEDLPDLSAVQSSTEALMALLKQTYGDATRGRLTNWAGQISAFLKMKQGDLVILPLKTRAALAIGE